MRDDNLHSVAVALARQDATVSDLVQLTSLSRPTILSALTKLGATKVTDSWPTRWHLDAALIDNAVSTVSGKLLLARGDGIVAEIGIREGVEWPAKWDEVRGQIGRYLATLSIHPDSDVSAIVESLTAITSSVASLTYHMQINQAKPDWFEQVGGHLD